MIAMDTAVDTLAFDAFNLQPQYAAVGAPPLNTYDPSRPEWMKLIDLPAEWRDSRAELDASNNAISTVHQVASRVASEAEESVGSWVTANTMILRAQTITGLSLKDLAAVYGVTRQTLYNYKKQTDQSNSSNWKRLQKIDKSMAELEQILPASPGALAKRFANENGETLLSLLQQENPDVDKLKALAAKLAEKMDKTAPVTRHQTTLDELTRHC